MKMTLKDKSSYNIASIRNDAIRDAGGARIAGAPTVVMFTLYPEGQNITGLVKELENKFKNEENLKGISVATDSLESEITFNFSELECVYMNMNSSMMAVDIRFLQ